MRADELLEPGDLPGDAVDRAEQDQVAGVREALEAPQVLGRPGTVGGQRVAAIGLGRGKVDPAVRPEDQRRDPRRTWRSTAPIPGCRASASIRPGWRASIASLVIRPGSLVK